jgi:hypothetical protein
LAKAYKQKEKEQPPPKPKEPEGPVFSGSAGALYAKEFPKLAAIYGKQLWVDETPQARLHLRDLEKIPEKFHLAAKNAGIRLAVGPGTLNDFKHHSPEAAGLIAQVNKQKRNAKQTGGVYFPGVRLAITGDGQYDKFGTFHSNLGGFVAIHEFGHAYDLTAAQGYPGVTSGHDFIQLWRKMADTTSHVRPYFLQDDIYAGTKAGGWTVGAAETYAESFALYFGHGGGKKGRDEVAKTFTPEIADWMHGHLQNAEKKK